MENNMPDFLVDWDKKTVADKIKLFFGDNHMHDSAAMMVSYDGVIRFIEMIDELLKKINAQHSPA